MPGILGKTCKPSSEKDQGPCLFWKKETDFILLNKPLTKHTFAILAYKKSDYLEPCICSILNQEIKSDIIICTSTPSDFITHISEKYKIPLFINPEQKGIAQDWSFAYKMCRTKYVTLAHQDDIYRPSYTRKCLNAINKNQSVNMDKSNALIIFTDYSEWDKNGVRAMSLNMAVKRFILLLFFSLQKPLYSTFLKRYMLSLGSFICCPSVMYNKSRINSLNFDSEYSVNMDWAMWHHLAGMQGSFVYVPERLVVHRLYSGSATSAGLKNRDRQNEDLRIFRQTWPSWFSRIISKLYSLSYISNRV